jgi:hypothetical protein
MKRYTIEGDGLPTAFHAEEAPEGEWVRYEDAAKLLDGAARGAKDLLEACGAAADVEEGRDPIEAARAVRTELVQTHDRANAAAKRLTTAVWLLERIDKIQPKALGGDVASFLRVDNDFSTARTKAEQAVLDACADLMDYTLTEGGLEDNYSDLEKVVAAVKALRELKP